MITKKTKETTKEYDEKGNLLRETVIETEEHEDNNNRTITYPGLPSCPPYHNDYVTCTSPLTINSPPVSSNQIKCADIGGKFR